MLLEHSGDGSFYVLGRNIVGTVLVMLLIRAGTGASRDHLGREKEMPARSPRLLALETQRKHKGTVLLCSQKHNGPVNTAHKPPKRYASINISPLR